MQLLLLLALALPSFSYKILVYNVKFAYSTSNFQGKIADVLVDAGHNVTSLISEIDMEYHDGTAKSNIIRISQSEETRQVQLTYNNVKKDLFYESLFDPIGNWKMSKFFGALFALQCEAVLDEPGLIDRLKNEKYDVMIAEHFDMCGVALSHLIKPKTLISTSSSFVFSQHYEEFGIPQITSFMPASLISHLNVHSMFDRLKNIVAAWLERLQFYYFRFDMEELFYKRFGPDYPSLEEISSNASYIFVNSEPLIDFATPTMNKVVYVGGIGNREPKPLTEEWSEILNRREKTVLFSFGSVMKSIFLSPEIKQSIITMIRAFPNVTFIWKYEKDDEFTEKESKRNDNLVFRKWTPQGDLLNDKRLALFVTHGGMGSTQEIAARGVPAIFVPLFADQPRNGGMMEHNKLARVLNKFDIVNPDKLIAIVKEVLENEMEPYLTGLFIAHTIFLFSHNERALRVELTIDYRLNARRSAAMLAKKPFSAKEKLIKYTEFAAEFGSSPALRPQSHDMNWIEYYNVDIIFVFGLFLFVVVFGLLSIARKFVSIRKAKKD